MTSDEETPPGNERTNCKSPRFNLLDFPIIIAGKTESKAEQQPISRSKYISDTSSNPWMMEVKATLEVIATSAQMKCTITLSTISLGLNVIGNIWDDEST